mgnify:CR=1 FL=1
MKQIATIRNTCILFVVLVFLGGCTTAKTVGTQSTAVAATPASDSDGSSSSASSGASDSDGSGFPLTLWMVSKGEHLWGISSEEDVYGDPYQWPLLFKRNRDQIEDADLIYPGQMLYIERGLTEAEISRAVNHAKTRGAWTLGITELSDLEYLSRERSLE